MPVYVKAECVNCGRTTTLNEKERLAIGWTTGDEDKCPQCSKRNLAERVVRRFYEKTKTVR